MKKAFFLIAALAAATANARPTEMRQFAPGFASHTVQAGGRTIYYRIGGSGPAVLLLHGYGDTGQMWSALAPVLAKTHTVIVPDLPGLGNSRPENPTAQYDMASVARSIHSLMQQLKMRREAVVGHDIGLIVAYSYAAQFRSDVTKLALMDGPIGRRSVADGAAVPGNVALSFFRHVCRTTHSRTRTDLPRLALEPICVSSRKNRQCRTCCDRCILCAVGNHACRLYVLQRL
jgi:pimeloyl-ACP methyl ester carboxylesterase